jgi:hypothetical protein
MADGLLPRITQLRGDLLRTGGDAANKIESAITDGMEDGLWDNIGSGMTFIKDFVQGISSCLGIVSLFCALFPGLRELCALLTTLLDTITLICDFAILLSACFGDTIDLSWGLVLNLMGSALNLAAGALMKPLGNTATGTLSEDLVSNGSEAIGGFAKRFDEAMGEVLKGTGAAAQSGGPSSPFFKNLMHDLHPGKALDEMVEGFLDLPGALSKLKDGLPGMLGEVFSEAFGGMRLDVFANSIGAAGLNAAALMPFYNGAGAAFAYVALGTYRFTQNFESYAAVFSDP